MGCASSPGSRSALPSVVEVEGTSRPVEVEGTSNPPLKVRELGGRPLRRGGSTSLLAPAVVGLGYPRPRPRPTWRGTWGGWRGRAKAAALSIASAGTHSSSDEFIMYNSRILGCSLSVHRLRSARRRIFL